MYPVLYESANFRIGTYGVCIVLGAIAALSLARVLYGKRRGISRTGGSGTGGSGTGGSGTDGSSAGGSGTGGSGTGGSGTDGSSSGDNAIQNCFAPDTFMYAAAMCIAGAFTGAFLFRPLTYIPELIMRFDEVRALPAGVVMGMMFGEIVFYGGLIGAFAALYIYCRISKQSLLLFADIFAPAAALGHAFGRVGCFFGGCCYGTVAGVQHPIAVRFPAGNAGGAPPGVPLIPVQLIEAACLLIIAALLCCVYNIIMYKARQTGGEAPPGLTASLYALCYGAVRFVLEFYRGDPVRGVYGPLSLSQYVSIALIAAGAAGVAIWRKKYINRIPADS